MCVYVRAQVTMPESEYVSAVPALSTALSAPHIRSVYEVGGCLSLQTGHTLLACTLLGLFNPLRVCLVALSAHRIMDTLL